jgi:nucleoside-diphosphate-sugar epimerase
LTNRFYCSEFCADSETFCSHRAICSEAPGSLVAETRAPAPTSQRGKLRAEMEQQIRAAGIRYAIVRLPELYGPNGRYAATSRKG